MGICEGRCEKSMKGSIACNASPVLPAVPISSRVSYTWLPSLSVHLVNAGETSPSISPGFKRRSLLPLAAPERFALLALASQLTHARCCALSPPPPERFPRMFVIRMDLLVRADRQMAIRISCPPPSRVLPSSSRGSPLVDFVFVLAMACVSRLVVMSS